MTSIGDPSFARDKCFTPAQFREQWEAVVCGEGVQNAAGGDLLVSQTSGSAVSVAAGDAWIEGTSAGSTGMYYVSSPTAQPFTVTNTGVTHQEAVVAVVKDDEYDTGPTGWSLELLEPYSAGSAYPNGPLDGAAHSGLIVLATMTVDGSGAITSLSDTRPQATFCESMVPVAGAWTQYTPTWTVSSGTAPTLGNGTIVGWYQQIGKTVHFRIRLTIGSTTAAGSGFYRWGVPVAMSANISVFDPVGDSTLYDSGTPTRFVQTVAAGSSTTVMSMAGGTSSGAQTTNTFPFVPAYANSTYCLSGTYEAA